jgi:hypothetical protein
VRRPLVCILGLVALAFPIVANVSPASANPGHDVRAFGSATPLGAPSAIALHARLVGMAAHPKQPGYWLLGQDGGVFTYGRARFFGSTGNLRLNAPVVGIASTPTGNGYYLVAEDGGVFTFGDAKFRGSTGNLHLSAPVTAIAITPSGRGYWLLARDGGVFAFGDAKFQGAMAGFAIGAPFVGIDATRRGGYALVAASGAVFGFGDALSAFEHGAGFLSAPIVDVALARKGRGGWLLGADGAVYSYGGAPYLGGANNVPTEAVGIARAPSGTGYWVAVGPAGEPVPAGSGFGRRIVYSNSMQRVWLVEDNGFASHSFPVSGKRGVPAPGTYHVFSKSNPSFAGSLRLPHMTRFAHGRSLAIGFHGIPLHPNGTPIQSDAELGQYRSHGCVRMNQDAATTLDAWAPIGTTVVVLG